jgi:hypothetical protein
VATGGTARGPYFDAMFPPARVTAWINFKRRSTGVNIARRLWDQREELRQQYEALHGTNQTQWPARHPRIVLDAVQWVAHPACLAWHWFHHGVSMREANRPAAPQPAGRPVPEHSHQHRMVAPGPSRGDRTMPRHRFAL